MEAMVCKQVEQRTGVITLTGHGPERLWKLYAEGLVAEEVRLDVKETLDLCESLRRSLALCEALRRDQRETLRKYRVQRLQEYFDASAHHRRVLRRRALREDPGIREIALSFCALGIALGASAITVAVAFML